MLAESGNAITFYALYIASKVGATGLTVTVDVYEKAKGAAASKILTGQSATEIGDGLYSYDLASGSVTSEGEYIAVFKTADTSVDRRDMAALWVIDRRIKASATIEVTAGAKEVTYTLTSTGTGLPIPGAVIWICTDPTSVNVVWRGNTDSFGIARDFQGNKPWLQVGTWYVFAQKDGYYFDNPDTENVS